MLLPILMGASLLACSSARAEQKFQSSDIGGRGSNLLTCDLDGDGLKDLVVVDDLNVSIFYQDRMQGFTRQPQQTFSLEHRPCIVWAAKLGQPAESLLVLTSEGVTELAFTNRTSPPDMRQIIRQPTIVPGTAEETQVMCLPMSAATGNDWPLLLVPTADGLQVWQHRDQWRKAQLIGHAIDALLQPSPGKPGFTETLGFALSVGDLNGDGRDDLMLRRGQVGRTRTYSIYLQQTNGQFAAEPALTYVDKLERFSWLCWADLNHDGRVDLIKSVWLNEPSFFPGVPSGKVVVSTYLAHEQGRIPAQPQQHFRKNDWIAELPVADVDGDGFLDLVLGYSHLDSREDVSKVFTAKELDYSLKFHFYRPGAGFPEEADCQRDLVLHVDREELVDWYQIQSLEQFVTVGGDFKGDGKADLVVRDRPREIAVYFFVSRAQGFSLKPDLRFSCPERIEGWQVADLNNDGVSDLIVKMGKENGYRIFVSQK